MHGYAALVGGLRYQEADARPLTVTAVHSPSGDIRWGLLKWCSRSTDIGVRVRWPRCVCEPFGDHLVSKLSPTGLTLRNGHPVRKTPSMGVNSEDVESYSCSAATSGLRFFVDVDQSLRCLPYGALHTQKKGCPYWAYTANRTRLAPQTPLLRDMVGMSWPYDDLIFTPRTL
jgi:hypothetical protein